MALGEQLVERGGRVHSPQIAVGVGGQEYPVAGHESAAVPDGRGQAEMALSGHAEYAVRRGTDDEQPSGFSDVQACAGCPPERAHDGVVGDASPTVYGGVGACGRDGRQRQRATCRGQPGPWSACVSVVPVGCRWEDHRFDHDKHPHRMRWGCGDHAD